MKRVASHPHKKRALHPVKCSLSLYDQNYFLRPNLSISERYLSISFFLRYARSPLLCPTILRSPLLEWKSFGLALKWSFRSLILAVRIATCASGDPLSSSVLPYSLIICSFISFVIICHYLLIYTNNCQVLSSGWRFHLPNTGFHTALIYHNSRMKSSTFNHHRHCNRPADESQMQYLSRGPPHVPDRIPYRRKSYRLPVYICF